jgi:hypothetical protein
MRSVLINEYIINFLKERVDQRFSELLQLVSLRSDE